MLQITDESKIGVGCLWFTYEVHFHLEGFMNKQNWRIWGTENPSLSTAKLLHSPKINVWAGLFSKGIIGPFFIFTHFETINSFRYTEV